MNLLVQCQRVFLFQQSWFEGWEIPSPGDPRKATVLKPNLVVHPKYCQGEDVWLMLNLWCSPDRGRMPVGESLQNPLTVGPGLGLWAQTGWLIGPGIYKAFEVSKVFTAEHLQNVALDSEQPALNWAASGERGKEGFLGHGPLEPAMCFYRDFFPLDTWVQQCSSSLKEVVWICSINSWFNPHGKAFPDSPCEFPVLVLTGIQLIFCTAAAMVPNFGLVTETVLQVLLKIVYTASRYNVFWIPSQKGKNEVVFLLAFLNKCSSSQLCSCCCS